MSETAVSAKPTDLSDEIARARDLLVAAGARVTALGLSPGTSGNLSVRCGDRVVMSPTGSSLAELTAGKLSLLNLDGTHLDGPAPSKEYPFHLAFYARDPGISSVVHLHSSYATAQACLPPWGEHSALPPITPYLVMRVGQVPLIPYAAPGDTAQAETIRTLPLRFTSVLLANHGQVTSGVTLEAAIDRAIEIEEASKLLHAIGSRKPRLLDIDQVSELTTRYGTPWLTDRLA